MIWSQIASFAAAEAQAKSSNDITEAEARAKFAEANPNFFRTMEWIAGQVQTPSAPPRTAAPTPKNKPQDARPMSQTTAQNTPAKTAYAALYTLLAQRRAKAWQLPDETALPLFYQNHLAEAVITALDASAATLAATPFWWVQVDGKTVMVYDSKARLLWQAAPDVNQSYSVSDAQAIAAKLHLGALGGWRLPSQAQLWGFAEKSSNPLRSGNAYRLVNADYWLTSAGRVDLDGANPSPVSGQVSRLIAVNPACQALSGVEFLALAAARNWGLTPHGVTPSKNLLATLTAPSLAEAYTRLDSYTLPLPDLEPNQFTDLNKGLWELWGLPPASLEKMGVRARNPAIDVREGDVAIDFGTSSTVVAYTDNGQSKLLRIGAKDFWATPKPEDYENPTVLELVDLAATLAAWQSTAYRPSVKWGDVRVAHEAQHNFRNNDSNPRVMASILSKIKQWALREGSHNRLRLTDQTHQKEHELAPLSQRQPVKGQALVVGHDDPFDPIELYAWFLGMAINWRGRGLFLSYYMTFPVAYPKETKANILASFRRGLQRSLPPTLLNDPIFQDFSVEERASEPAAYAAAALPHYKVAPTPEGQAYAVFDFGGGTTDFDFGYYRLPTAEEEDAGYEQVFEHFGAAGDRFLGGENLLENMAYLTFKHNLELCRKHKIAFSKPLDAEDFPGSDMFLEKTQAAQTNTLMLMAKLRPLWETGHYANTSGVEKMGLLPRDSHTKVECDLAIPVDALKAYLEKRIEEGVFNFLAAMHKAFTAEGTPPAHLVILLAGNASRSTLVLSFFGLIAEGAEEADHTRTQSMKGRLAALFGDQLPTVVPYPPIPMDATKPYQPTAKTGVALGLLSLCPGNPTLVINHTARTAGDNAPFQFYVGRIRQGLFQPGLKQGQVYGEWHELGKPAERVFNLVYTQSPQAHTEKMPKDDPSLRYKKLTLAGESHGQRVFGRAMSPAEIELCTATSLEALNEGAQENTQRLTLVI